MKNMRQKPTFTARACPTLTKSFNCMVCSECRKDQTKVSFHTAFSCLNNLEQLRTLCDMEKTFFSGCWTSEFQASLWARPTSHIVQSKHIEEKIPDHAFLRTGCVTTTIGYKIKHEMHSDGRHPWGCLLLKTVRPIVLNSRYFLQLLARFILCIFLSHSCSIARCHLQSAVVAVSDLCLIKTMSRYGFVWA